MALNLPLVGVPATRTTASSEQTRGVLPPTRWSPAHLTEQALAPHFAQAAVLVNASCGIQHYHGRLEDFLTFPAGEPTQDLLALVRKGLRSRLRAAVKEVLNQQSPVSFQAHMLREDKAQAARVTVLPAHDDGLCVVTFEKVGAPVDASPDSFGDEEAIVQSLEDELKSARQDLQNTIEELETSNEELKASNEEAMSMNEELQSTNEELETSKEELQSVNEELTTLNSQLQEKVEELETANNDLDNLITSTDTATLFLDPQLQLKRFTPTTTELLQLIASDVGRPISDLSSRVSTTELVADCEQVLKDLRPVSREVRSDDGRWYVRRTLPYRTQRKTVEGVVITFNDVTDLKRAQEDQRRRTAELEALMESVPAAVWITDTVDCRRITGNRKSYEMLRLERGANVSKSAPKGEEPTGFKLFKDGRELTPDELPIQRAASTGKPVMAFEEEIVFTDGEKIHAFGNAVPLLDAAGKPRGRGGCVCGCDGDKECPTSA